MGLKPLLVQFATWRFVKEKGVGRVSYLLPQGVPRFLFCYPSTPLRAVVSQISTFLTVAYRRSITLVQGRMKVATAALIVKRLQTQDAARRAASQSATQAATQSATQSASQDAPKAEQTEQTGQAVKREGEELTTAAKRVEVAVKQEEEKQTVAVKRESEEPPATAQSPLRIRVKVKTEAPTGKSLLAEVLEAPQWQQPDRSGTSPR